MRRIERGEYSPSAFIDELKTLIRDIVMNVLNDNSLRRINVEPGNKPEKKPQKKRASSPRITKLEQIICPKCGKGHILKGKTAYGCSEFKTGCDLRLPFTEYSSELTPGKLSALIKKKFNG